MNTPGFNIAAVERDTGLSKDVLRVWERRYGFPAPERDAHGERVYPPDQVERLRLVKRLMDQGHRPGKLMSASTDDLSRLASGSRLALPAEEVLALDPLLDMLRRHEADAFAQALAQRQARQGLLRFVLDTVAPLTQQVGQAWEVGRIEIFEEHLFTELCRRQLRQAISDLARHGERRPKVLLTTVPGESHELGLLMVEALLALEGAECVPLGTQTPVADIARAALAHQADIVALSFSTAFPSRQVGAVVAQLRDLLPPAVALWIGGQGSARGSTTAGVSCLAGLAEAVAAVERWRVAGRGV